MLIRHSRMSLLEKCPLRSGMLVRKHAVNPSLEA